MVSLLFHQDPKQVLHSHVWGCDTWHSLSLLCRERLDRLHHPEALSGAELLTLQDQFAEALLDCYVHTRICKRCKRREIVASEYEQAIVPKQKFTIETPQLSNSSAASNLPEVLEHQTLQNRSRSETRDLGALLPNEPLNRFSVPAWNIEFALSQRV